MPGHHLDGVGIEGGAGRRYGGVARDVEDWGLGGGGCGHGIQPFVGGLLWGRGAPSWAKSWRTPLKWASRGP